MSVAWAGEIILRSRRPTAYQAASALPSCLARI